MLRLSSVLLLPLALGACATSAQRTQPAPDPIVRAPIVSTARAELAPVPVPPAFQRALREGTRTLTGEPGPRYWQQWSEYALAAELDSAMQRLRGRGSIRYTNRSPDTLRTVAVHLYQNVYRAGARRNVEVPVTGGVELTRLVADGRTLAEVAERDSQPGYWIDGTIAWLRLPTALRPGGTVELGVDWTYRLPGDDGIREGTDGEVAHVAYWYPQMVVYDDVNGWQDDLYMGRAEFYMGYGDYDVRLTVPQGWLIGATGTLQNPRDVLTASTLDRLARARRTGDVVHVVADAERGPGTATVRASTGKLTWHFAARNVRDFVWSTSPHYLWDATIANVGDADADSRPDTAMIHTLYRPSRRAWAWDSSAHYTRHSVEFLSELLWPYPYPHMTSVDGVSGCSGMEWPMLTCIGGSRDTLSLYSVIVHEVAHMWFPMQVGSDEKRYSWMDEGLTRYNQSLSMNSRYRGFDRFEESRRNYATIVADEEEVELMRHGDLYPVTTSAFSRASYDKMSLNLRALRAVLGDEVFLRAYREYGRRWRGKHPTPYDFWNTFENVSGRDLDWFWRTWWFDTRSLDQAIAAVRVGEDSTEIVIEDRGEAPMPVLLELTRANGATERILVPVDVWLSGAMRHTLRVASTPRILRVAIDPEKHFLDIDRGNQTWTSGSANAAPTQAAPPAQ